MLGIIEMMPKGTWRHLQSYILLPNGSFPKILIPDSAPSRPKCDRFGFPSTSARTTQH